MQTIVDPLTASQGKYLSSRWRKRKASFVAFQSKGKSGNGEEGDLAAGALHRNKSVFNLFWCTENRGEPFLVFKYYFGAPQIDSYKYFEEAKNVGKQVFLDVFPIHRCCCLLHCCRRGFQ